MIGQPFTYGSVCSGIEAATMAWHPLGWQAKFFSEIEAFPSAVLAHHYGSNMPGEPLARNGIPNHGDFTTIGADAGPVDLLVGGTPCQSFSVAGKRLGLDDPRGNLALEYLELATRLRARWIVWENVPGVLSAQSGRGDEDAELGPSERDFATFLSFVQECGYGFAYRVLDAQYVRVSGYERAVPQRRRRVFVVGYLGDFRPAAAVLFDPESLLGNTPPRREAGPGVAAGALGGTSPGGGWRFGADEAAANQLVAYGGNNCHGPIEVAASLAAHGGPASRLDFASETFVATRDVAVILTRGAESAGKGGYAGRRQEDDINLVAFDTTQITSKANYSQPKPGDPCHPLAAGSHPPAVAFNWQGGGEQTKLGYDPESGVSGSLHVGQTPAVAFTCSDQANSFAWERDVWQTLDAQIPNDSSNIQKGVRQGWAVRRLMPVECERLQGFPDGFTDIPYRGRRAADGPRYKALGNSMAVNVMRWIGERIHIFETEVRPNL